LSGLRNLDDLCRLSSEVRSSIAGFFFLAGLVAGSVYVPSMSRSSEALLGNPLAMAEFDVCWEIESGSVDLS